MYADPDKVYVLLELTREEALTLAFVLGDPSRVPAVGIQAADKVGEAIELYDLKKKAIAAQEHARELRAQFEERARGRGNPDFI